MKKCKWKRIVLSLFGGLFLLLSAAVLCAAFYIEVNFEKELPNDFFAVAEGGGSPHFFVYDFSNRENRTGERSDVTEEVFAQKNNVLVSYGDLSKELKAAFVAIEDKRFYSHNGVDWKRTASAAIHYLLGSDTHFGGSTITQQTVKNMTGERDISIGRKIQEMLYAIDLERNLDKSQILELYLNIIPFSDNCIGIGEAARHYFGKEVRELTASECASLAAITNSPSYYHPVNHPQNNLYRRDLILYEMQAQGYLTKEEAEEALAFPLSLNIPAEKGKTNSWYTDMVIEDVIGDLMQKYSLSREAASTWLYHGGLQVDMAMDPEIQKICEDYYRNVIKLPQNKAGERAQSALIVIHPETGDILGVVGAAGEKCGNRIQNFATQTKRSPGSSIKPLSVYAPALEKGIINWASVYDDVPVNFGFDNATPWPKNATGVYRGLTNIAYAVAHSTNTVAVKVLEELGTEEAYHWAKENFGLFNLTPADCDIAAMALGQLNYGLTLREMTAAYTAFADGGVYHPYRSYFRVTDKDGNILLSKGDQGAAVLSRANADIMTKLLQGVVKEGTSSAITLSKTCDCAGKTGTTQNDGDRWFIGYTPDYICGVWCGYEYPEPLSGRNLCTSVFNGVMKEITEEKGGRKAFSFSEELLELSFCLDSGALLTDTCKKDPRGEREGRGWFTKQNLPEHFCQTHILCRQDPEGGIDHGYCPDSEEVALIKAERSFPKQIIVTDAQFVYRGDPLIMPPIQDQSKPYFYGTFEGFCGISHTNRPFHRSCPLHNEDTKTEEEFEDPLQKSPWFRFW